MSNLFGKLKKKTEIKGAIENQTPQFHGKLEKTDEGPRASMALAHGFSGVWSRVSKICCDAVHVLDVVYRFVAARMQIWTGCKAKAGTAPVVEIKVDNTVPAQADTVLTACDAQEAAVNHLEKVTVFAKLVAYNRAAVVHIKKIFMAHAAKASATWGVIAKHQTLSQLERISKATAANSSIMESRFNTVKTGHKMTASPGMSCDMAMTAKTVNANSEAAVSTAAGAGASIDLAMPATHSAKMATWIEAVVVDGVLILRQVYSATLADEILEVI